MRIVGRIVLVLIACGLAIPARAQLLGSGIVYDPTQSVHAISQIREAEQLYTTASQTRDQVIATYNLAHRMAQMPPDLYRRYAAEFSRWTTLSASNTYGNTNDWIVAANTGASDRATAAISKAGVALVANPDSAFSSFGSDEQSMVKSEVATAELADGVSANSLVTMGQIRAHSQALNQQISNLESDAYSNSPDQQTEMAALGKINAAAVMQLRSQQDTNQILSAAALNQMLAAKDEFDRQKRAINQAVYFQQNFMDSQKKVMQGMSQSMESISYSTRQ
jgi:hypothetical protein